MRRRFLSNLLRYRKLSKLKTTYTDPLRMAAELVQPLTDSATATEQRQHTHSNTHPPTAIFCSWNATNAGTGRLSTSLPNLQALPKGTQTLEDDQEEFPADDDPPSEEHSRGGAEEEESTALQESSEQGDSSEGRQFLHEINIRNCFLPSRREMAFISADFNQMEMRIMADCSGDPQLLHFFHSPVEGRSDIYTFMAGLCFDCEPSQVTKEQRSCAKQLSLGILYGMVSGKLLSSQLRFFSDEGGERCIAH